MTIVIVNASRIPPSIPSVTIARPPSGAPTTRGTRINVDCTANAIDRRSRGSESPMTANVVGNAPAFQAITASKPDEDEWPAGSEGVDDVSGGRDTGEREQGPSAADSIGQPPSGILIDAVEQ